MALTAIADLTEKNTDPKQVRQPSDIQGKSPHLDMHVIRWKLRIRGLHHHLVAYYLI